VLRRWRSWSRVLGKLKRVTTVGIPKYVWDNTTPQSFLSHHWSTDDAYISSREFL
jgi:hypothetical protein